MVSSDVAFTPSVKAVQQRKGSREAYARMEDRGSWATQVTPDLKSFIEAQTSVFLATATFDGQPYIQHRGGPPGFLKVLDPQTLGFADFIGNRQYITLGNLAENPRAHLFLIDYATRQRVKLWGEAQVIEDDPALVARLMPADYRARAAQAIAFRIRAWDANCPQHIPQRMEIAQAQEEIEARDARIRELEAELGRMRNVSPRRDES
jgi:uncharacterized protein